MKPNLDFEAATKHWFEEFRRCRGEVVSELRIQRGWTQGELAKRAGVSLQWLQALEANRLRLNSRMRHEIRILSALGFGTYEIKDFYGRVEDTVKRTIGPSPWQTEKRS
jgi:transcriptional regulator with XRE-family HTH domain